MSDKQVTPGNKLKALHHSTKSNLSLKDFARSLLKGNDSELAATAKLWFHNKSAAGKTKRDPKNENLAKTIGAAVKLARRAKSSKK